ncbi:hypothetical protein L210DRAFT_3585372 [Boletus edulis BED1]|uniref:Uncharacterized protein n=1 Tax=Boletus edulis BED1 TaxID=1328754 RepID=A0AAD4BAS2_BOLED|nr:hypothetical protein L210DRAFT_3585372 [Boletus edulis BED1]
MATTSQYILPLTPATLDAASRRISLLFQIVIFDSFSGSQEPEPEHLLGSQQDDDAYVLLTGMRGSSSSTLIRRRRNNLCNLALYSR